jgi:hypothetical protein
MNHFKLRPLSESDINQIIENAGGIRAHSDSHIRKKTGADYVLGNCVIELKALDDEGLAKPERQAKLAALFGPLHPNRPVVVLDRESLPATKQRDFDRIMETPIKTAVTKANKQLKQSKLEHAGVTTSIIWFVNNGYTALDHDALLKLVIHRVRNDTDEVDGVIVSGCYFHSNTFDNYLLWPFEYVPINLNKTFPDHDKLLQAWQGLAAQQVTALMQKPQGKHDIKGPVVDTQFDIDKITYVKPAPPLGEKSDFFRHGRPRLNSTGITTSPQVGLIFGDLSFKEWTKFRKNLRDAHWLGATYEDWKFKRADAAKKSTNRKVFNPIPITWIDWSSWADQTKSNNLTTHHYATQIFQEKMIALLAEAKEIDKETVMPDKYMLIVTEEIGQDKRNDISHAAIITVQADGTQDVDNIFHNQRIFYEYAMTLGCAHAVALGVKVVRWRKDYTYAWR